jgi:acyl-CoA dehydrogenase
VRRQFHTPIGKFEGVQEALARIAANSYAGDALRETTAAFVDLGQRPSVLGAVAKQRCTERMRQSINDAMDIMAGRAVCDGPSNPMFRNYQAIPVGITVEGANILTRSLIIFGQGAIRGHPWILAEMDAARNPDSKAGLRQFDRALFGHLGFLLANLGRVAWYGLSRARFATTPVRSGSAASPELHAVTPLYRQLSRLAAGFALSADITILTLGGKLKRMEHLSGRLADIFSELYTASCALRRFQQEGAHQSDLPLVRWSVQDSLYKAQQASRQLLANLPSRSAAWLLRRLLFPWGDWAAPPSDQLTGEVAAILLSPSASRDRLTAGVFVSDDPDDVNGRLEHALLLVTASAAIERRVLAAERAGSLRPGKDRLQSAVNAGIIDADEAEQLRAAEQAAAAAIRVDDFAADELSPAIIGHGTGSAASADTEATNSQKNPQRSATLNAAHT